MSYFLPGFLLLAGFLFWGAGLVFLVTPGRYRRFSWIFAAPLGLALQSLTVWCGAHTGMAGTDVYGRWSLALPLILAVAGWLKWRRFPHAGRTAKFWPVLVLMVLQLSALLLPFAVGGRELTTVSIGSLDAADYGAGARVLQEFSSKDRTGFMGQTETVSVGVVDNFFDFWLRTNHFTPSAIMALNGSLLGLKPHQMTGLVTIVLLTMTLPMVFWLARVGLRFRGLPSLGVAAIYGFSPVNWYAAAQVSPAQIVAANAIALLTWSALAVWREGARWKSAARWAGLLFAAYGLVFGGYNFIIVVALVPAVTVVGVLALKGGQWGRFGRWSMVMLVLLLASGLAYFERLAGVIERLALFSHGYGWAIASLTPEGWLGFVDGPWLTGYAAVVRWPLAVGVAALILGSWWWSARRSFAAGWTAAGLAVGILAGYGWLQIRALSEGAFTSYEAYKLFAVFYPGMLAAFCVWINAGWSKRGTGRLMAIAGLLVVLGANVAGEWRLFYRLMDPPLAVEKTTIELGLIEKMPEVASVNMRLEEGWVRLWANAYLLRKNQYFEIHSYEGRGATALKGEWDLVGDFFHYELPGGDTLHPANGYTLIRRRSPFYVEGRFGSGWGEKFRDDPLAGSRTRWAVNASAKLVLVNPQPAPLRLAISAWLRALGPRSCYVKIGGVSRETVELQTEPREWNAPEIVLPPGETVVEFFTPQPPEYIGGRTKHPATFAIDGFDVRILGRVQ